MTTFIILIDQSPGLRPEAPGYVEVTIPPELRQKFSAVQGIVGDGLEVLSIHSTHMAAVLFDPGSDGPPAVMHAWEHGFAETKWRSLSEERYGYINHVGRRLVADARGVHAEFIDDGIVVKTNRIPWEKLP